MPLDYKEVISTAIDLLTVLNASPPIEINEVVKPAYPTPILGQYFFPYYFIPSEMGNLVSSNIKPEQDRFLYNQTAPYFPKKVFKFFPSSEAGCVSFPVVDASDWVVEFNEGVVGGVGKEFMKRTKSSFAQWLMLHNVVIFLFMPDTNKDLNIMAKHYMPAAINKFVQISQDGTLDKLHNDLLKQFPYYGKLLDSKISGTVGYQQPNGWINPQNKDIDKDKSFNPWNLLILGVLIIFLIPKYR